MTDDRLSQSASRVADLIFDVLSHAEGVNTAAEVAKHIKERASASRSLQKAILQAERDFIRKEESAGMRDVADAVLQLPIQDTETFQRALKRMLLTHTQEDAVAAVEEELAQVGSLRGKANLKAAARLYVESLRKALWQTPEFRDVARDVLLWEMPRKLVEELRRSKEEEALERLRWPGPPSKHDRLDFSLLKAQARLVPFVGEGRKEMLEEIVRWAEGLHGEGKLGVRMYVGAGGSGKTRLAVEAGDRLAGKGWVPKFLPEGLDDREVTRILGVEKPLFLVVDYAGHRAGEVERLLKEAARVRWKRRFPLAILLLDRAPSKELMGIFEDLTDAEGVGWAEFLGSGSVESRPIRLAEMTEDDRAEVYREAYRRFREISAPDVEAIEYEPKELPERPLAVIMLAMLASQGHRVVRSREEGDIFRSAWDGWEKGKWKKFLFSQGMGKAFEKEALGLIEAAMVALTLGRP